MLCGLFPSWGDISKFKTSGPSVAALLDGRENTHLDNACRGIE